MAGGSPVNITWALGSGLHYGASWAPDGAAVAFTRRVGTTVHDIKLADIDPLTGAAGNFRTLVSPPHPTNTSNLVNPMWSPDGAVIAWSHGGGSLNAIDVDGTDQRVLTTRPMGNAVDWQPVPASADVVIDDCDDPRLRRPEDAPAGRRRR